MAHWRASMRHGLVLRRRMRQAEPMCCGRAKARAMLATARWMYRSALARQQSRGMHRRDNFPDQDVEAAE